MFQYVLFLCLNTHRFGESLDKASWSWSVEVSLTSLLFFIFGGSFSIFIGEMGYKCDGESISFTTPA